MSIAVLVALFGALASLSAVASGRKVATAEVAVRTTDTNRHR